MALLSNNDRNFKVGETVHMRVRVSEAGTKSPADATSTLTALRKDGAPVALPAVTEFSVLAQGDHLLVLRTADLATGDYEVVVTVSDGPDKVSILTDRFVLKVA